MKPVIDAFTQSTAAATLVGAGLAVMAVAVFIAGLLHRTNVGAIDGLVALAVDGKAHEARIRTRRAGSALKPLLAVLGADPRPPPAMPIVQSLVLAAVCLLPLLALPVYALAALSGPAGAHTLPLTIALMGGIAVLLPCALASAIIVAHLGARTARAVRAACVRVLAMHVQPGGNADAGQEGDPES